MANKTINLNEELYSYLLDHSLRETPVLQRLRKATAQLPEHNMQIAPEQGQFMQLLIRLMGAKRIIEVGTFTGYSALSMAQALPADGELICCDISREWMTIGEPFWEAAAVQDRIKFIEGPALESLDELLLTKQAGSFDMAFIDADKENYQGYFERCLQLVRQGGLILVDNTLWGGSVCDPENQSDATRSIRAFNIKIAADERVFLSQIPLGDGLTMAVKN